MNFSILQAVYKNDNPEYLEQCFKSINDSTLKPEKIILVKDGYIPDVINELIEQWESILPILFVGYDENQGLAHALNFGLQYVDTDLVARMDSDDICYSQRFEKQVKAFEQNPDMVICGTAINEFYLEPNNKKINKKRYYPKKINKMSKELYKGTPIAHPTVMIKTQVLKENLYSENTSMNEDIDLWFRLVIGGYEIHNLHDVLLDFRITDGTFKRRSITKAVNEYKIYTNYLRELFGFSLLLFIPLIRLFTRFLPYTINKRLYFSNIRKRFFNDKK